MEIVFNITLSHRVVCFFVCEWVRSAGSSCYLSSAGVVCVIAKSLQTSEMRLLNIQQTLI